MARKKPSRPGPNQPFTSKGAARGRPKGDRTGHRSADARPRSHVTANRRDGFAGGDRPYDYSFYEAEPATPEYMSRLFQSHSFRLNDRQLGLFWRYYELLREHNASLDLTRIMGIEATVLKHFVDSAVILDWIEPNGPLLDIGSGPGFPGVPIAVMRPDLKVILGESRGKRVGFLGEVVQALKLKNVTIFPKSVREDSPLGRDYGQPVGDVITRALETIPPTLERVLPFVEPGGRVIFMKGPSADDEVKEAESRFAGIFSCTLDKQYVLPGSDQGRRLVVFQREKYGG